ncbi:ISKra4 family transposase [Xenorhabdus bovienii]|uniref:ISKra4 family transposase n=1 Tax=Xenorhabdus bovienii TaxID=40576 RepID=UPI0023B29D2D|nr:ISKra4 family transposase [Xenorhabdus bovienii]MDE9552719.1 ISKra4 family transposase [Xenorhabdus bovienii]
MQFTIQITVNDKSGHRHTEKLPTIEKQADIPNDIGLSLSESKLLLNVIQQSVIQKQAAEYLDEHRACPCCQRNRRVKNKQTIQYRTLFGIIPVEGIRVYRCACEKHSTQTVSLLNHWCDTHTHPELRYIETRWASLMSYGLTANLLKDILPVGEHYNAATVRNHLCQTAKRQEAELEGLSDFLPGDLRKWEKLPKPGKPMTVGIDGGYVRNRDDRKHHFEVIAGKSFAANVPTKRFGFVQCLENHPRRKLIAQLSSQGMQANQQITFLSDGADNIRDLQFNLYPESQHVLDWFHITMRLTVLKQYARGVSKNAPELGAELLDSLTSTKWYLWHGNVIKALEHLDDCAAMCDEDISHYGNNKSLLKHIDEMYTYIENNSMMIPNYGEMYRYGEAISSSFVESTINEVIAKRMVKKQQMQWSQQGAHYLLQTRTAVLNGDLKTQFEHWYPGIKLGDKTDHYWTEAVAA